MFNPKGIRFIHERTGPLAVYNMEHAAEVIGKALDKRAERLARGEPLDSDAAEVFGRHIAWLIGFDALVEDRKAIRAHTDLIVQEAV